MGNISSTSPTSSTVPSSNNAQIHPTSTTTPRTTTSTTTADLNSEKDQQLESDSPQLPPGHPTISNRNLLARGCPVALIRSASSSISSFTSSLSNQNQNQNQNRQEPPDSPHSHPAVNHSDYQHYLNSSESSLESGLVAEGELTPPGLIPAAGRGNSEDGRYWQNPSANALFRALKRKEKGIEGEDAINVSEVHNAVTTNTWNCIMEYEQKYSSSCHSPTLARFYGMDGIYSMKAKLFHHIVGIPLPFDRHDWIVDRCGKEVRYIIDYHSFEQITEQGEPEVFYSIDARPAPTAKGIIDRATMAFTKWRKGEQWY